MIIVKFHCYSFKCLNYISVTLKEIQTHIGVAQGNVCDVYQNLEKGKYKHETNE